MQEERAAVGFWDRVATEGSVGEAREDHAAEDIGDVATQLSLGEVDDQDLAVVHDPAEAERFFRLGQGPAHNRMREKGAELVGNRGNAIKGGLVVHRGELPQPELPDLIVRDAGDHFLAEGLVEEQAHDVLQISLGLLQQRQQRVAQDVLHARTPGIGPLLLQGVDEPRGNQRPELARHPGQGIVAIGAAGIRHVPDQRRLRARPRDLFCQIAMRIQQTEPVALPEILAHEVVQECRLAGPGLAEDVNVLHPVGETYAKGLVAVATVGRADHGDAVGVPIHSPQSDKGTGLPVARPGWDSRGRHMRIPGGLWG